jgi:DNA-binding FadR family transcriptional regulator
VRIPPFDFAMDWIVTVYLPKMQSGEVINGYKSLAKHIGVSNQVVREVMRVLEFHNVIDITHGKTTKFVSLNRPSLMYVLKEKGIL